MFGGLVDKKFLSDIAVYDTGTPFFLFPFVFFFKKKLWIFINSTKKIVFCFVFFQRRSYGLSQSAQEVGQMMGMWAQAHGLSMLLLPLIVTCSSLGAVLLVEGL